jgi:hypothetical protein
MIQIENIETWGFEHAVRGMRNPLDSWDKSDSYTTHIENPQTLNTADFQVVLGENDLALMRKLYESSKTGNHAHRKYLRQIFVSMDIVAPLYWWKEFDTYKVGTVANSCSTMHTIHKRDLTMEDFSTDHLDEWSKTVLSRVIGRINAARKNYVETGDKNEWWQIIQLLPSSFNQRRTVTMNYENVVTIIRQRSGHKLDEWREMVEVLKDLPYIRAITEDEA